MTDQTIRAVPDGFAEIDHGMTNFDHAVDDGFEERLRNEPVWGRHAAWNFNGRVWFEDGVFHEQVWRCQQPRAYFSAPTLAGLMEMVCDAYGWE